MPENSAIALFTAKSADRILAEGGTAAWRLDRGNARRCTYAVCTRNAHSDWGDGREEHRNGFLVGKISDVVPCDPTPENNESPKNRYLIAFSEYALVNVPDAWQRGFRNPVRYTTLNEIGVDPLKLTWLRMPAPTEQPTGDEEAAPAPVRGQFAALTLQQAKAGLALTFGVAPESIEITIRG